VQPDSQSEANNNQEVDKIVKNYKLNYLKLKELLISIGLINESAANSDSNERVLLYDFWKIIRGEEKEEVLLGDVKFLI
jgi:hypothetical protein